MKAEEQTIEEMDECLAKADPQTRGEIKAFIAYFWEQSPAERAAVLNRMREILPTVNWAGQPDPGYRADIGSIFVEVRDWEERHCVTCGAEGNYDGKGFIVPVICLKDRSYDDIHVICDACVKRYRPDLLPQGEPNPTDELPAIH